MMKRFEIIKNSESHTGYQIEDVEYKGNVEGLLRGWQYEFQDKEGNYHYNSVAYEWEDPDEYANRWTGFDGRSWLYDLLPADFKMTGRVIFRGYAKEMYDLDERDTYVEMVTV